MGFCITQEVMDKLRVSDYFDQFRKIKNLNLSHLHEVKINIKGYQYVKI